MWGNQAVSRCHFYRLKLSDKVSSNICTLDDGIRLQDELNELLDKLTDQDVAERLDALSEHGALSAEVNFEAAFSAKVQPKVLPLSDKVGPGVAPRLPGCQGA